MSAYFIANPEILNPEAYEEYRRLAGPIIAKYGGRFLVRGSNAQLLEGEMPGRRIVVIEFPSVERAKEWYYSPEYQEIVSIRHRHSRTGFGFIVEGV